MTVDYTDKLLVLGLTKLTATKHVLDRGQFCEYVFQFQPGIDISSDATRTLRSFCRWQKRVMMKPKTHPEHHDVAILLTK